MPADWSLGSGQKFLSPLSRVTEVRFLQWEGSQGSSSVVLETRKATV